LWLSFFGMTTTVSAFSFAEARTPALHAEEPHFLTPRPAPQLDVRNVVTTGYCTFCSAALFFLGLIAATRFVVGKK
jgi:hypothetical protein